MKKSRSFHLEEDLIKEMEEYKKKYNLSSLNAALERMLIERRTILKFKNGGTENFNFQTKEEYKEEENQNDELAASIENSFDNMPE